MRLAVILLALVLVGSVAVMFRSVGQDSADGPATAAVDVDIPELSATARSGEAVFNANCAECHGTNAAGTDRGPPLIHKIYEPSHHGDAAFLLAARQGVRAHHWSFGDMPAIPAVSDTEIAAIIAYVRELQRYNGIR